MGPALVTVRRECAAEVALIRGAWVLSRMVMILSNIEMESGENGRLWLWNVVLEGMTLRALGNLGFAAGDLSLAAQNGFYQNGELGDMTNSWGKHFTMLSFLRDIVACFPKNVCYVLLKKDPSDDTHDVSAHRRLSDMYFSAFRSR